MQPTAIMRRDTARTAEQLGILLSLVEAVLFVFVAVLHFGIDVRLAGGTYATPFLYPAAILEAAVALGLVVAVVLPARRHVRAGRVIAAQVFAVIGIVVGQVALMYGANLTTARNEIFYGVALVLSLGCIALLGVPAYHRSGRRTQRA
ncbi:MAG TPA: hypothetical protein VFQ53_19105 [Kofleriaceae bacterium]|nr:hypothetical protein [Kofleriaceae bacterium]